MAQLLNQTDLANAREDADDLAAIVNGPAADVQTRTGGPVPSLRKVLDAAETTALIYRDQARAASESAGPAAIYDTKAAANTDNPNLSDGDVIEVTADETRGGLRTRYRRESGNLVFKTYLPAGLVEVETHADAQLLASNGILADGDYVRARTYASVGDRGGAEFKVAPNASSRAMPDYPRLTIISPTVYPEHFGCQGDDKKEGTADPAGSDDLIPMRQAIEWAKANNAWFECMPGARYYTPGELLFGTATAQGAVRGFRGNGAIFRTDEADGILFNWVGSQNGDTPPCDDLNGYHDGGAANPGRSLLVCGRAKQDSGPPRSSGLIHFRNARLYGHCNGPVVDIIQSESNSWLDPYVQNYGYGPAVCFSYGDYYKNCYWLPFTAPTGTLVPNQIVTETNSTATARILKVRDGVMLLQRQSGDMTGGETITGPTGSATGGVISTLIPKASVTIPLEEESTYGFQRMTGATLFQSNNTVGISPTLDLVTCTDFEFTNMNLNHNAATGDLVHVRGDDRQAVLPSGGAPGSNGMVLDTVFCHNIHAASLRIGDAATPTQQLYRDLYWKNYTVGTSEQRVAVEQSFNGANVALYNAHIITDGDVDLGVATALGLTLRSTDAFGGAEITATGTVSGVIEAHSETVVTLSAGNSRRAAIYRWDKNYWDYAPRTVATITDGSITHTGERVTALFPETADAADTLTDIVADYEANGSHFMFICPTVETGEEITVEVTGAGNLNGKADLTINDPETIFQMTLPTTSGKMTLLSGAAV